MKSESGHALETRESGDLQATEGTRPGPVLAPAVDIFESADTITVLADIPGVTPDKLNIDLDDNVLTITGHCDDPDREDEADVMREYRCGTFQRRFTLSELVDQSGIDATISDGVLTLTLPKVDRAKPMKIRVKAAR